MYEKKKKSADRIVCRGKKKKRKPDRLSDAVSGAGGFSDFYRGTDSGLVYFKFYEI